MEIITLKISNVSAETSLIYKNNFGVFSINHPQLSNLWIPLLLYCCKCVKLIFVTSYQMEIQFHYPETGIL